MTDANRLKPRNELVSKLKSLNEDTVLSAINELRTTGTPAYIPVLTGVLSETTSQAVVKSILSFLSDLKNADAIPVLIKSISEDRYLHLRKELISCCWQNGLDYSSYLSTFVDWVIESEFEVALEAFTVIENLEKLPGQEIREAEVEKINQALSGAERASSKLLEELLRILN